MIHAIYKSHEGQFQFYFEVNFTENKMRLENGVLHIEPSVGGKMTIDTEDEIMAFVDLVRSVYDGEECASDTIIADFTEQELEDIIELFQLLRNA